MRGSVSSVAPSGRASKICKPTAAPGTSLLHGGSGGRVRLDSLKQHSFFRDPPAGSPGGPGLCIDNQPGRRAPARPAHRKGAACGGPLRGRPRTRRLGVLGAASRPARCPRGAQRGQAFRPAFPFGLRLWPNSRGPDATAPVQRRLTPAILLRPPPRATPRRLPQSKGAWEGRLLRGKGPPFVGKGGEGARGKGPSPLSAANRHRAGWYGAARCRSFAQPFAGEFAQLIRPAHSPLHCQAAGLSLIRPGLGSFAQPSLPGGGAGEGGLDQDRWRRLRLEADSAPGQIIGPSPPPPSSLQCAAGRRRYAPPVPLGPLGRQAGLPGPACWQSNCPLDAKPWSLPAWAAWLVVCEADGEVCAEEGDAGRGGDRRRSLPATRAPLSERPSHQAAGSLFPNNSVGQ